jgi:hypothetical protein
MEAERGSGSDGGKERHSASIILSVITTMMNKANKERSIGPVRLRDMLKMT